MKKLLKFMLGFMTMFLSFIIGASAVLFSYHYAIISAVFLFICACMGAGFYMMNKG